MNRAIYTPVFHELALHVEASGGSVVSVDDQSITLEYPDQAFAEAVYWRVRGATKIAEEVVGTKLGSIEREGRRVTCRRVQ